MNLPLSPYLQLLYNSCTDKNYIVVVYLCLYFELTCLARWYAILVPATPPPTMTVSAVSRRRFEIMGLNIEKEKNSSGASGRCKIKCLNCWLCLYQTSYSVNALGCRVLKFWPNILLIKACYQVLGQVCKFVLRCKNFYRIGPWPV